MKIKASDDEISSKFTRKMKNTVFEKGYWQREV